MTRDLRRRLRRKGLDARQIKVYAHLHSHCFNGPECWPSQKLIAKRCGMSRQLVNAVCQELRDHGVLSWTHEHRRGSEYKVNVYRLRYWSRPKIRGTVRVLKRLNQCSQVLPDTKGQSRRALAPLRDEQPRDQPPAEDHPFLGAIVRRTTSAGHVTTALDRARRSEFRRSRMDQRRRHLHVADLTCLHCTEKDQELAEARKNLHKLSLDNTMLAERVSGHAAALEAAGQRIRNLETQITRQARKSARSQQVEAVIEHWRKRRPKTRASSFPAGGKNWQTIEKALGLMAEDEDGPVKACCEAIDGLHIAPWEAYGKRYIRDGQGRTLRNRLEHALGDETRIERCRGIVRRVRQDGADRAWELALVAEATYWALTELTVEQIRERRREPVEPVVEMVTVDGLRVRSDGR